MAGMQIRTDTAPMKRTVILALIFLALILFFALKFDHELMFEHVKASAQHFEEVYARHPVALLAGYFVVSVLVTSLGLPGTFVLLALAGGAFFGFTAGALVFSFASAVGATLACATSRFIARDFVMRRFGDRLAKVAGGIRREGAFYLLSLRLIPVIPFFLVNVLMGLTAMSLGRFYGVSQLGMLPVTLIYVNAGNQLGHTDSLKSVLSPGLVFSFVLLGIFPLAAKRLIVFIRRRARKRS